MANHGVYIEEQGTSFATPNVAESGIPFVVGVSAIQTATKPAAVGVPVLCTDFAEAKEKLGYSENWEDFTLSEFMFSHFNLFQSQPVIFVNLLDLGTMKTNVSAETMTAVNKKIKLPIESINDETLVVKTTGGGANLSIGEDYIVFYDGENCIIELLSGATEVSVAYSKVNAADVTANMVATGFEAIEHCMGSFGIVPDLICSPKFSNDTGVAAVMAAKAGSINGMFKAKALIDLTAGDYEAAIQEKGTKNLVDENQIVCYPKLKLGDKVFHMSTQLAGLMAIIDTENGGMPNESPSNKALRCDALIDTDGNEMSLTVGQGNILNSSGIVTGLNFMGSLVAWGNYTACYPTNSDVKDYFIPVSRMFGFVGNTLIKTFWGRLDSPMTRRFIDTIVDSCNIWLNGLVGSGYLLGARVEFSESENSLENLMAGIVKLHVFITPASPAQEIRFTLEYSTEYATAAFA